MQISPDNWSCVSRLLDEALDLDAEARGTWMENIGAAQPELAPILLKLLAAHASSETADLLQRLPSFTLAGNKAALTAGLAAGARVGPYRLIREIAGGGMADVWLAERADGAFEREVALKLPHVTRLRGDLATRFAHERDILALLEHPHIARFYDAGLSADGLPYLAMEYIDGLPINQWCDELGLGIAARIRLFGQVLEAVQYAHVHLVIHRDLKPSNILVTRDGQARLLDFGIAKLLSDGGSTRETQLTLLAGRVLTPDYASPEQIKGDALTIATDTYSLGVVLYELLCGQRPYKLKLRSAAQLEMAIVDAEPARPSSAITAQAGDTRGASGTRLVRTLAGDLDTIVLKALAKAPVARYATVAEFAQDLERYLDGRAILARPTSLGYRARKFIRRNRVAVAGAGAFVAVLLSATATSLWQAEIAREKAAQARREARRAQAVQQFLLDLFRANTDAQPDPLRAREMTARELLDVGAARVTQQLRDEPEVQDDVLSTLSEMYQAVGLDDKVAELDRQRLETRRRLYGPGDPRVAEAMIDLARSLQSTSERAQAPELLRQAQVILDAHPDASQDIRATLLLEQARSDTYTAVTAMRDRAYEAAQLMQLPGADREQLGAAWRLEARASFWLGQWNTAMRLHELSIGEARRSEPEDFPLELSNAVELAEVHARMGNIAKAEKLYRETLAGSRKRNGDGHVDTIHVETRLSNFLHETSRRGEARALRAAVLRKVEQGEGGGTPNLTGIVQRNTAFTLFNEGQFDAAASGLASDVELRRRLFPNSITLASALFNQSQLSFEQGRYEEALALLDEAEAASAAGLGPGAQPVVRNRFLFERAWILAATNRADAALELLEQVTTNNGVNAKDSARLSLDRVRVNVARGAALLRLGRLEAAAQVTQAAREELTGSVTRDYHQTLEADVALLLGRIRLRLHDAAEARPLLEHALALRVANDHEHSPWIADAEIALAECMIGSGRPAQARVLLKRAAARQAAQPELGAHFTQPLRDVQGLLASRM